MLNSFRNKMIAAIFGTTAGALVLGGAIGYPLLKQGYLSDSRNLIELTAHSSIAQIASLLQERQGDMAALQKAEALRGNAAEIQGFSNDFAKSNGYYDLVVVADSSGKILGCNSKTPDQAEVHCKLDQNIANDPVFAQTLSSQKTGFFDIGQSKLNQSFLGAESNNLLTFATPLYNAQGGVSRVVMTYVNVNKIFDKSTLHTVAEMREQGKNLKSLSVVIADQNGTVIESNLEGISVGTDLKDSKAIQAGLNKVESFYTEDFGSKVSTQIIKAHPMEVTEQWSPKWAVLTTLSENEALGELHQTALYLLGAFALALLGAGLFARQFGSKVSTKIQEITAHITKLATGDLKFQIQTVGNDELAGAAKGLNQAAQSLSSALNAEKLDWEQVGKAQSEAYRLTKMVQSTTAAVMLCDLDRKITYYNPALVSLLAPYESKLRGLFPEFDLNNLIGKPIDLFHKNPKHQAGLLSNLTKSYKAEIKVLDMSFALTAVGLFDESGKQIGNAVEWVDITPRERYRAEVNKLISAAKDGNLSFRGDVDSMDAAYKPMLEGIHEVVDAIVAPIMELQTKLNLMSNGNLNAYVTGDYKGDHAAIKNAMNQTLNALNDLLIQVRNSANQVNTGGRELSSAAQTVSQGATEAAASIEEISSSMAELVSMTKENAVHARSASELASGTKNFADKGNTEMNQMMKAMNDIDKASHDISKIIKVIDEIAFQTNLLALNAAVEAARAGTHGKGFAVVAEEVRSLAARSSKAAKETSEMIENTIAKVSRGSSMAQSTQKSLTEIVSIAGKVASLVEEIHSASVDQSQGLQQINQGISQLDAVTQQNSAASEEAAASSEELAGQSNILLDALMRFKLAENRPEQHLAIESGRQSKSLPHGSSHSSHGGMDYSHMDLSQIPDHCRQYMENPPSIDLDDPLFDQH